HEEGTFAPGSTMAVACTLAAAAEDFIGSASGVVRRGTIDHDAAEFSLTGELVADEGGALHASDRAAEGEHFNLDAELIAGRDLLAKFAFVDAGEQHQLRVLLVLTH